MNENLKKIQDLFQKKTDLNEQDKEALIKAIADADKQWTITEFKLERTEKAKRTAAILLEETIEELEQKRKAVELQNHELEIESSLERVRTVAMSMNRPDDMLHVCQTIGEQLDLLKVKEIRNVQTAIFYQEKGTYMNYEYYAKHNKTFITETTYTNHKIHEEFANKMLKGNGEFMIAHIKGNKVKEWLAYQKTTNVFIDDYLNIASSLNYYWFSLGPVALGISTYDPLSEEETNLFKRFLKVFELSYRRYLDIEKAEAQAHEAKVEASLEKVRAVAMSMRKSEELIAVCEAMYKELKVLGFVNIRNSQIAIKNESRQSYFISEFSDHAVTVMKEAPYNSSPLVKLLYEEMENSKEALYQKEFSGKEFDEWRAWRKNVGAAIDSRIEQANSMCFYLYSFGKGYLGISTFNAITKDQLEVLKRFKNVFELSYTRYIDVAQAEAQAREAQIELALERVRARAMAMQKSEELAELVDTVFKELTKLDFALTRCILWIMDVEALSARTWMSNPEMDKTPNSFYIKYPDHSYYKAVHKAWKERNPKWVYELKGKEKKSLDNLVFNDTEASELPDEVKTVMISLERIMVSFSFHNFGALQVDGLEPLSDESLDILYRFGKVFDLNYTRFLDLKNAEAQARESQIQLALERVRARTMAMQKSDELAETASVLFKQLVDLGIRPAQMRTCAITTLKPDEPIGECWITSPEGEIIPQSFRVPYDETSAYKTIYAAWKNGEKFLVVNLSGDALIEHLNFLKKYAKIPTQQFQALPDQPKETFTHAIFFSQGYLFIISNEPLLEYHEIFKRFGGIFQQTYTRFLDLKKAEDQARESQIQLALERVRARTMAMQKSDELSETVFILFQQFKQLGENPDQATIGIINEEEWVIEYWVTIYGNQTNRVYKFPIDEPNVTNRIYNAWKEQKKSLVIELSGKELFDFANFRESMGGAAYKPEEKKRVINVAFFSKGIINVQSNESRSEESIRLLERFAGVFEQTYTRFLDLKKAEAQAREAKIEAALEKVRSRSLAMHKSDEIKEVVVTVMEKMNELNIEMNGGVSLVTFIPNSNDLLHWYVNPGHVAEPVIMHLPYFDNLVFNDFVKARNEGKDILPVVYSFEEKNKYFNYAFAHSEFKIAPEELKKWIFEQPCFGYSVAIQKHSAIFFNDYTGKFFSKEDNDILIRFSRVFEQAYVRFLDLQRAEAQAREAQIEAALERVRSRSMGMQKSEELKEVIQVVYDQFVHLNIHIEHTGFLMDYKERDDMHIWLADQHLVPSEVTIPFFDSPPNNSIKEAKEKGQNFFTYHLTFEEKNKFYRDLFKFVPDVPEETLEYYFNCPGLAGSGVLLENIGLYIENFSGIPYSDEDNKTLMRFGKVFQQTYTRFLDLQKAEAQALEAIKRASVDRVRAEIASMRTTNDLERITPLIWNELTVLGIPFIRCGVFIIDEEQEKVQTFLYTEGKTIASFTSTFSNSKIITEALPFWRRKEIYKTHWDEAAFLEQAKSLVEQGSITTGETYLTEHRPTDLYLHFLPFLQGLLYVGDAASLSEEHLQLVQALADAFSTAYARYEDFNKLEAAKQQVDKTLVDLKQTQAQLVQSEKMASLGELTAGIAHEIQNPLNFVNNFSEVNKELLAELNEEIEKGNYEEVKMLASDVISNEEKINHHGKRADAIVKGMLQHSRSSTNVKEPTDINKLADEYLRLAYHGLRAKDKSFNAELKTDYDETIGKINIVPQDIGRAVLNLITNAFYAVTEKKKVAGEKYEPTISVSTKKTENQVSISVSDNGNGIPQKIVDKIFQPFFTTKPTGQGTGLGLSLSYDIIKAHGGEIKVESKDGEGSEFIITLNV